MCWHASYLLIYAASNWHFGLLDGVRATIQTIDTLVHTAKLSVSELCNLMKLLDITRCVYLTQGQPLYNSDNNKTNSLVMLYNGVSHTAADQISLSWNSSHRLTVEVYAGFLHVGGFLTGCLKFSCIKNSFRPIYTDPWHTGGKNVRDKDEGRIRIRTLEDLIENNNNNDLKKADGDRHVWWTLRRVWIKCWLSRLLKARSQS